MVEIVINATNVSPDVLVWLKKARMDITLSRDAPIAVAVLSAAISEFLNSLAIEWIRLPVEDAWIAMEKYVGAAPI